jgi:hypothetical protein
MVASSVTCILSSNVAWIQIQKGISAESVILIVGQHSDGLSERY